MGEHDACTTMDGGHFVTGARGQGKTLATFNAAAEANPEGFTLAGYARCAWCGESVRTEFRPTDKVAKALADFPPPYFVLDVVDGWIPYAALVLASHGWTSGRVDVVRATSGYVTCRASDAPHAWPKHLRDRARAWAARSWHRILRAVYVRGRAWGPTAPPPPPGFRVVRKKELLYVPARRR